MISCIWVENLYIQYNTSWAQWPIMHTLFTCSCTSRWSGRVLPPVTEKSRVWVVILSYCTGEDKAYHWHPSLDPAQSGSSLHWVRPFLYQQVNILSYWSKWELQKYSFCQMAIACTVGCQRLAFIYSLAAVRCGWNLTMGVVLNWWLVFFYEPMQCNCSGLLP